MLIIKDIHGTTEPLSDFTGLEVNEEVNGDFSINLVALNTERNKHAYPLLQEESTIEWSDHEFRVKKITQTPNRKVVSLANHVFFDLIGHRVYDIFGGSKTVDECFSIVLTGTGWTYEVVDDIDPQLLFNSGEDNVLALIRQICDTYECEVKIEPNKHLRIYKQIGANDDFQFRYKHNIKAIKENVDTTKLATVIKGFGGDGLEVTYTSPNASVYGERHAEPVKDDRYTIPNSMIERLKRELTDVPEVSIEIEEVLLDFSPNLGDTVWLIHEKLGIEFQTRIMARKDKPLLKGKSTVTLGNRPNRLTDILTKTKIEIDENKKEFRSRIEQTNEQIRLEVEEVNESIAAVNVRADNIILSVEQLDESIAQVDVKADNIQLSVSSLNSRMSSAESSISIQAGQITSKVSTNDFNGNTIASKINQSSTTITLDAQRINMLGITNVNNTLFVGENFRDSTPKGIYFRGNLGGVVITSPGIDSLYVGSGTMQFDTDISFYSGSVVDFSNATVTGINTTARFG
ncbi:phage tail protein [Bacillus sp. MCCB 382]|uniref:phage tail spike protein n=1 Tax=Bacillus sp. MCCB 382 TaxID=2860197 RepID=UPI001C572465|nr:phage tail protein [Bacillus sp. MCCB 382]